MLAAAEVNRPDYVGVGWVEDRLDVRLLEIRAAWRYRWVVSSTLSHWERKEVKLILELVHYSWAGTSPCNLRLVISSSFRH